MLKKEIRKQEILKRKNLSSEQLTTLNLGLLNYFKKIDLSDVKVIHLFLPIAEKNEPNTFLIIQWLEKNHPDIKIIVPKINFTTQTLQSIEYSKTLIKNKYHILEPHNSPIYNGKIDIVFVPLLAFDDRGYRVGYGKGFYDRFLAHKKTLKIGLSFFNAIDHITDINTTDIKLDLCITPDKIINF